MLAAESDYDNFKNYVDLSYSVRHLNEIIMAMRSVRFAID